MREINRLRRLKWAKAGNAGSTARPLLLIRFRTVLKKILFSKKAKMFAYKRTNPHLSGRSSPVTATLSNRRQRS